MFKDIELAYDAPSGLTLKFYTDMPIEGTPGSLALRATLSFPATSGRQTCVLPLDTTGDPIEGTLYQIEITSTGIVRLFGGLLRVRGIGVWINGANGERWKTLPEAIGV